MGKQFLFLTLIWLTNIATAQVNEIGLFLGGSNLIGDVGATTFFRPTGPSIGAIYKFNKNPRIAYRFTFTSMTLNPDDEDSKNAIRNSFQNSLNKKVQELTAGIEYNFFEYNLSTKHLTSTPYFVFEIAAYEYKKAVSLAPSVAPTIAINSENTRGIAIPFGLGYKARLYGKFAFALEARIRYTFTDDLDDSAFLKTFVIPDTNDQKPKFNNTATNDWYAFLGASIVYTFGRPPCYKTRR